MSTQTPNSSPNRRVEYVGRAGAVGLLIVLIALLIVPVPAFGQADPNPPATMTATPQPTAVPAPKLTLSTSSGLVGAKITVNGLNFKPGETIDVTFGTEMLGAPMVNDGGSFSLPVTVPNLAPNQYAVQAKSESSAATATVAFTINKGSATLAFSAPQAVPGASLTVTAAGFQPGEPVDVWFNGALIGTQTADTTGTALVTFVVPSLAPASNYIFTATGQASKTTTSTPYTLLAGPTPVPVVAPTATPVPAPAPAPAPAPVVGTAPGMAHDDRYFGETGYRIENEQVWGFFQQYGGLSTFGYPVSRTMTFLGCPVQMFQRQIIQVCPGSGAALINMLDPEIFPYTQVNGSTFPAPDATMKNNTPPVGSPTYSQDINAFITANVPDTANGQPVSFFETFNRLSGLTIWGAPISAPMADPANSNFIYQRFQRGIMHYVVGQGTQSILLADYLKAIMMNQNVPTDLLAQSRETRYFNQYCPGQNQMSLCRPNDLPGTDLTFAFVQG